MNLIDTFFNWAVFRDSLPALLQGLWITILLGVVSIVAGLVSGLLMALLRLYAPAPVRALARIYIDVFRSIPLLVLLVLVYYALPFVGIRLSSFASAATALTLVSCAYTAEIFRAGIEAIPKGQFEAAASLALSRVQTFLHVVLPPALKKVWPALTSQIIIVMLGSAVCGQISTQELSYAANLIQSRNFRAFEAFIVATGIYLLLSIGVRGLLNWLGPRYLFGGRRG